MCVPREPDVVICLRWSAWRSTPTCRHITGRITSLLLHQRDHETTTELAGADWARRTFLGSFSPGRKLDRPSDASRECEQHGRSRHPGNQARDQWVQRREHLRATAAKAVAKLKNIDQQPATERILANAATETGNAFTACLQRGDLVKSCTNAIPNVDELISSLQKKDRPAVRFVDAGENVFVAATAPLSDPADRILIVRKLDPSWLQDLNGGLAESEALALKDRDGIVVSTMSADTAMTDGEILVDDSGRELKVMIAADAPRNASQDATATIVKRVQIFILAIGALAMLMIGAQIALAQMPSPSPAVERRQPTSDLKPPSQDLPKDDLLRLMQDLATGDIKPDADRENEQASNLAQPQESEAVPEDPQDPWSPVVFEESSNVQESATQGDEFPELLIDPSDQAAPAPAPAPDQTQLYMRAPVAAGTSEASADLGQEVAAALSSAAAAQAFPLSAESLGTDLRRQAKFRCCGRPRFG